MEAATEDAHDDDVPIDVPMGFETDHTLALLTELEVPVTSEPVGILSVNVCVSESVRLLNPSTTPLVHLLPTPALVLPPFVYFSSSCCRGGTVGLWTSARELTHRLVEVLQTSCKQLSHEDIPHTDPPSQW